MRLVARAYARRECLPQHQAIVWTYGTATSKAAFPKAEAMRAYARMANDTERNT
jgi:hypothetical protein